MLDRKDYIIYTFVENKNISGDRPEQEESR